jgi:hypothetical protein
MNGHRFGYLVAILIGMGMVGLWIPGGRGWVNVMFHAPAPANAAASAPSPSAASSCDALEEAILTGSKADIVATMNAVLADTSATATAREYAGYYLGRDAANRSVQEKQIPIIRFYCAL